MADKIDSSTRGANHKPSSSRAQLIAKTLEIVSPSELFNSTSLAAFGRLGWENASQLLPSAAAEPLPEKVAYVRIARPFLQGFVQRQISHEAPVHDFVLGSQVTGRSTTIGATSIVFVPDKHCLAAELRLNTAVKFESVASQQPVHIHMRGLTHVEAGKRITFDGQNFIIGPAWARAQTESTTTGIESDLGIFNRLSVRIASRKVAEQKTEIDRITADHTAAQVRQQFERAATGELGQIESLLREQFGDLTSDSALSKFHLTCSTTSDAIELVLTCDSERQARRAGLAEAARSAGQATARNMPPHWSEQPSDLEVFVHSGLIGKFVRDRSLQQAMQPILEKLNSRLAAAPAGGAGAKTNDRNPVAYWQTAPKWSYKGPWYAVSWSNAGGDDDVAQPPSETAPFPAQVVLNRATQAH